MGPKTPNCHQPTRPRNPTPCTHLNTNPTANPGGVTVECPAPTVNIPNVPRATDYRRVCHGQVAMTDSSTVTASTNASPTDHCPRPTVTDTCAKSTNEEYTTPAEYANITNSVWPTPTEEAINIAPFYMKLCDPVQRSAIPNYMGIRCEIPSQINCDAWDIAFKDYHDREICDFMCYGWPVSFTSSQPPLSTPVNHSSATRHLDAIRSFLRKELDMKAILGQFDSNHFTPWTKISP